MPDLFHSRKAAAVIAAKYVSKAKWAVAAAAVLLMVSRAAAQSTQSIPYTQNFTGVSGATGGMTSPSPAQTEQLTTIGFTVYSNGTGSYYPHIVNSSTNKGVYYKQNSASNGKRSLCMPAANGSTYGNTKHVLLPTFTLPVNQLIFKCWIATSSSSLGTLAVGYVTGNNTTSFVAVQSFTANSASYCASGGEQAAGKGRDIEVDLSSVPSTATRIALRWYNNNSSLEACCIDDIEIIENPDLGCRVASALAVSSVTYTSATVTWDDNNGGTAQWLVSVNGGAAQTVSSTTYSMTGLTPNTEYTVEVVSDCGGGDLSDPTSLTFNTLNCAPVVGLMATPDYTSATLMWSEAGEAAQWQVALNGGSPVTVSSPNHAFTGLTPNTNYTATVRAVCAAGVYSDWRTVNFRTVCPSPGTVSVSGIEGQTLHVTWPGTSGQYEVQLASDASFSSNLQTSTVSTAAASFSGLAMATYYYVRVRAICGSDYSAWSDVLYVYMADFSSAQVTGLYPSEGKVVLNDLEPHDWSLYTTQVDKPLRTLNPVDAKITYRGYGTNNVSTNTTYNTNSQSTTGYVAVRPSDFTANSAPADVSVGISQDERPYHTFEYYKTLERVDGKTAATEASGRLEYQTIFNPFSRRPTYGNPANYDWATTSSLNGAPCWRGFYKWRIDRIAGGSIYISKTGGTALAVGDLVAADQKLYFDCTSAGIEVDFTAMWAPAIVRFHTGADQSNVPARAHGAYALRDTVGIERNFLVCDGTMYLPNSYQSVSPYLPLDNGGSSEGIFACTYTSVFPNGTVDGVEPAYGPVKEAIATSRVNRQATYIDLCRDLTKAGNSVAGFNSDTRFEYLAFSRLRGRRNGFHLDGSHAALWGTIAGNGKANLTFGRGIEPMFDDNKGTFNYIWGVGPISENRTDWGCRRNEENQALNASGQVIAYGLEYEKPTQYRPTYNVRYTIRLESGYVGCLMTMSGWNSAYQDMEGNDLQAYNGGNTTPACRIGGTNNYARFIMGTDFDRADEQQRVAALGTNFASHGYANLDSMLYHEVYKNAKVKIYRPFRVSSFNTQMNLQDKDSVYSDIIIKSGFIGQESIDRTFGHEDGGSGDQNKPGTVIVDGIVRGHWYTHAIYNCASNNNAHRGKRRMLIEGGFINSSVSGGAWDRSNDLTRWKKTNASVSSASISWGPYTDGASTPNDVSTIRMRGGHITGAIFGGSNTYTASGGGRQIILTGGTVRAWIAGGVNGTDPRADQWEGIHFGNTWIYAGGDSHVGSGDTNHVTVGARLYHPAYSGDNGSTDGNIFGAGCGIKPNYFRADSTETDHLWNLHAWKHHRGGRVDSSFIYIADQADVEGDVYGGGNYGYNNTEDNDDDDRAWTGGRGGSNTAKGKATLRILGGTVGGRVFGGSNMKMGREVDILMTGGHVKRGLYGGSNTWGYIKKDIVMNILGGTIGTQERPAIVCGGGLGKETAVFGNITLNFGQAGTDGPTIYGDIYGGSQQGTTNAGGITKTQLGVFNLSSIHGSGGVYDIYNIDLDTSAAQGYGYNKASKTIINFYSGRQSEGAIFGGGWGMDSAYAAVYGDVEVNILGGQVNDVFGCNNTTGKPHGKVTVNIGTLDSVRTALNTGDRSHRNRPLVAGSVYGGGRNAAYGGAPENDTVRINMYSGTVQGNVFGGALGFGAVVSRDTKVDIHYGTVRGNVYGGGNNAKVQGDTRVIIGNAPNLSTSNVPSGSFLLSVSSADPSMGSATGGGVYPSGASATLTATPNSGYIFECWSDGSTQNPRTVTVTGNDMYVAHFSSQYATLTVQVNDPSMGSATGGGYYTKGTLVSLTAIPNSGYRFLQWSDGNTSPSRSVSVTDDAIYTAHFVSTSVTVTVVANNPDWGTVSGGGTYTRGDEVVLRAIPNTNYEFIGWSDGSTDNPYSVAADNAHYVAEFVSNLRVLTVLPDDPVKGTTTGGGNYPRNTSVTITATPNANYRFLRWSDGSTLASRTITVTGNATYTAYFAELNVTITAETEDPANGSVTGGGTYEWSTSFTLTATPSPNHVFYRWEEACTGRTYTANPLTLVANQSCTYTARFVDRYATITVASDNTSMGSATGGGIYETGSSITITATPNPGYYFSHWLDSEGNRLISATRTVTVLGSNTYTAYFTDVNPASAMEWVDLGLPSGAKWAAWNIGADAPHGTGNRYAWGEIEPKSTFVWENYKYANGSYNTLTKYCSYPSMGYQGFTDSLYRLLPEDDIASILYGSDAHIPTQELYFELFRNTTRESAVLNGVQGIRYTGPNGNSIFIPKANDIWCSQVYNQSQENHKGVAGKVSDVAWTGTVSSYNNYRYDLSRYNGLAIRAVIDTVRITVVANNASWGTVSGGGLYRYNERMTITATPRSGYYFRYWSDAEGNLISFNSTYVKTVSQSKKYIAVFGAIPASTTVQWVNLGLPSGRLWADRNVGAMTSADAGYTVSWGGTTPRNDFSVSNYEHGIYSTWYYYGSSRTELRYTKYNSRSDWGYNGFVDNKTTLEAVDDAATVHIGNGARTPTRYEWEELLNNTTKTFTTRDGIPGFILTGPNGNSIFLPQTTGYYSEYSLSTTIMYWSSTLYWKDDAYAPGLWSSGDYRMLDMLRYMGRSIRAVK